MADDYTPREVAELLEQGTIQVIDVREPHEREAGRIAGSLHIPLADLAARVEEIDQARSVVIYCRVGGRSAMATEALRGAGYDAHNMVGGLLDWDAEGLPLDPDGGQVAEH